MVPFVGGVDGVPGDHGHPGGLLLLALGALVGFSVRDAGLPLGQLTRAVRLVLRHHCL